MMYYKETDKTAFRLLFNPDPSDQFMILYIFHKYIQIAQITERTNLVGEGKHLLFSFSYSQ
jgi:hypothetical protein